MLIAVAAVALLLTAPALGAGVLSTEQAAITGSGSQQNPAIAIDPDSPLRAVVVGEDGNSSGFPGTAIVSTANWSAGPWPGATLNHSGSTSAGQTDIAWGADGPGTAQNVYLVEEASSNSGSGGNLCTAFSSGVFFSSSADGGQSWNTSVQASSGSNATESIEPAIAVDRSRGRVYIVYAKLDFATAGCTGAPTASEIFLLYSSGNASFVVRRVSPLATSGTAHYRSPSVAVLPDGRVIVAFRNDSNGQVETETCTLYPSPPATNYCGASTAGLVGASTIAGNVGGSGSPVPSVVAAGGRVTVAWSAPSGDAVRAFAAMSTDGGATFGAPQLIDLEGGGNQIAPRLAATAGGRVDVAYLWDPAGTGVVNATAASAAPPLQGATTEAWGNPVIVQAITTTTSGGVRRLGVATANAISPLPATVVAFTDTSSGNQDVHVAGLLHGTSAPVIPTQTVRASKNVTSIVHVDATDADGDPLTWSTGAQPGTPGSSVSTADQARGEFAFTAANQVTTDTFEAVATDGLPGHEARAIINVNVVNDPPKITCSGLQTFVDTRLAVLPENCVSDPNHDPVTIELRGAKNGSVERVAGVWYFVPKPGSTETGSFVLDATDDPSHLSPPVSATVLVTVASLTGSVTLKVDHPGRTRVIASGMALRIGGSAVVAPKGDPQTITWNFGDHTAPVQGTKVAHRYREPGQYFIKAQAGAKLVRKTATVKVIVRRRAVELVGAPRVVDGVLQLTVRTRTAGTLRLKADSRSRTIRVPATSVVQALRIQVTTGPLVRLTLRLTPSKKSPKLRVFSVRRLVMVSPRSAG